MLQMSRLTPRQVDRLRHMVGDPSSGQQNCLDVDSQRQDPDVRSLALRPAAVLATRPPQTSGPQIRWARYSNQPSEPMSAAPGERLASTRAPRSKAVSPGSNCG